ncbi:MAG: Rne/Rng family ribonuclease, partial [Thermoguttaceae bacterium]
VIRQLTVAGQNAEVAKISITVAAEVAEYLSNKKRRQLIELEDEGKLEVDIVGLADVSGEHLAIDCRDAQGREVRVEP